MDLPTKSRRDWLHFSLVVLALGYALFAGLRTVSDFDLGWQISTGRYLVEHRQIPRVELFSYTAQGKEWIYPPFSGAIFYLLYRLGGYAALSWLGAIVCAATTALLCSAGRRATAALSFIAVPAIAFRTIPRAELFTTVLFAAVLAIVWKHHTGKPTRLWVLPVLFFSWVNLHLGFISGLGILGAGVLFDLCEWIFSERRAAAFARMKRLVLWLVASVAATLVNPWGWRIYEAIYRQNRVMQLHSALINEWSSVQFNWLALRQAVDARNPASADWWLLGAGAAAIVLALWKKHFGLAIVLATGAYLSLQHIRLQALFAILVVVLGGALFHEFAQSTETAIAPGLKEEADKAQPLFSGSSGRALAILGGGALALLGVIRVADLISNRYYVDSEQLSLFGTGATWWYPERAAAFVQRELLPRNIFHDYGQGGYLTWRLGPEYLDFVDGRFIPFGEEIFAEQAKLMGAMPDSKAWENAANRWNINTLILPAARYAGLGKFPLQDYCASREWKLVYLDDVSMVFVRNRPENGDWIRKFQMSCETAPIVSPAISSGNSYRARAERFNYLMNMGSIFYLLSRDREAASALELAEQLFPENPNLHLVKAQLFAATNQTREAEREFLRVVRTNPSDAAWYALARLYLSERRYSDALRCMKEAVPLSQAPFERLRSVGVLYTYMNQPQDALSAFGRAQEKSPYRGDSSALGKQFNAQLAEGRARAYRELDDLSRAVEQQELAAKLNPENAAWWATLADLYQAQGQSERAAQAREKAESLQKTASAPKEPAKPIGENR